MTPGQHGALLFAVAGIIFLLLGALLSGLAVLLLKTRLARVAPNIRHRLLVVLSASPVLVSMLLLGCVSLPPLISLLVPSIDHCLAHNDAHAHLCFVHLPQLAVGSVVILAVVFGATYCLVRGAFALAATWKSLRVISSLSKSGRYVVDVQATLIDATDPLCFTAGLWSPIVFVSQGFLTLAKPHERAIALAHEYAHRDRRDSLWRALVKALAVFHLPGIGTWLQRETDIAAEQACDEIAAKRVADRLDVAEAIIAVEQLVQRAGHKRPVMLSVAFGECAVERRVHSLLSPELAHGSFRHVVIAGGVAVALLLASSSELHHLTETFLSYLIH